MHSRKKGSKARKMLPNVSKGQRGSARDQTTVHQVINEIQASPVTVDRQTNRRLRFKVESLGVKDEEVKASLLFNNKKTGIPEWMEFSPPKIFSNIAFDPSIVADAEYWFEYSSQDGLWHVEERRLSVELRRCSDGMVVYVENVDTDEDEKLLDLVDQVVVLAPVAMLDSDCWRVIGSAECPPSVCPAVCFVFDDCNECSSCFELRPCNANDPTRYVSVLSLCGGSGGSIREGDTVLMNDELCYRVFRSSECSEVEGNLVIVRRLSSCGECMECYTLAECWGDNATIQIYKDDHGLENEDIVEIDGVCYAVVGQSPDCNTAFHAEIIKHEGCLACGCFLLTPCPGQTGVAPITVVGLSDESNADELTDGQIVRLDNGNCYAVSRTNVGCENAEPAAVIQEVYESCDTCLCYLLKNITDGGCDSTIEIETYSDLSAFSGAAVLRRAEDEKCYEIVGVIPWTEFAVEFTVEGEEYAECLDCTDPKYKLEPTCPSCEDENPNLCEPDPDATQISGGGTDEVTDHDLEDFVGRLVKYGGRCYLVSRASNSDATTLLTPIEVSGPFEDCETCQRTCLYVTVDVFVGDNQIKKMRKRIIVDRVCDEKEESIINLEECPTDN